MGHCPSANFKCLRQYSVDLCSGVIAVRVIKNTEGQEKVWRGEEGNRQWTLEYITEKSYYSKPLEGNCFINYT